MPVKVPEQADVPALRAPAQACRRPVSPAPSAWTPGDGRGLGTGAAAATIRTARILLAVIAREPEAVRRALAAWTADGPQ